MKRTMKCTARLKPQRNKARAPAPFATMTSHAWRPANRTQAQQDPQAETKHITESIGHEKNQKAWTHQQNNNLDGSMDGRRPTAANGRRHAVVGRRGCTRHAGMVCGMRRLNKTNHRVNGTRRNQKRHGHINTKTTSTAAWTGGDPRPPRADAVPSSDCEDAHCEDATVELE
jgi:hypothetical protein